MNISKALNIASSFIKFDDCDSLWLHSVFYGQRQKLCTYYNNVNSLPNPKSVSMAYRSFMWCSHQWLHPQVEEQRFFMVKYLRETQGSSFPLQSELQFEVAGALPYIIMYHESQIIIVGDRFILLFAKISRFEIRGSLQGKYEH